MKWQLECQKKKKTTTAISKGEQVFLPCSLSTANMAGGASRGLAVLLSPALPIAFI